MSVSSVGGADERRRGGSGKAFNHVGRATVLPPLPPLQARGQHRAEWKGGCLPRAPRKGLGQDTLGLGEIYPKIRPHHCQSRRLWSCQSSQG